MLFSAQSLRGKPEPMCSDATCKGLQIVEFIEFCFLSSDTGRFKRCPCPEASMSKKEPDRSIHIKVWHLPEWRGFPARSWISHPEHNRWGKQISKMSPNCNGRIVSGCSFLNYWLLIEGDAVLCFPSEGCRHFEHPAQWSENEIH